MFQSCICGASHLVHCLCSKQQVQMNIFSSNKLTIKSAFIRDNVLTVSDQLDKIHL